MPREHLLNDNSATKPSLRITPLLGPEILRPGVSEILESWRSGRSGRQFFRFPARFGVARIWHRHDASAPLSQAPEPCVWGKNADLRPGLPALGDSRHEHAPAPAWATPPHTATVSSVR